MKSRATFLFVIFTVAAFYSFGTFGLLNLFDARLPVQIAIAVGLVILIVNIPDCLHVKVKYFLAVAALVLPYSFWNGYKTGNALMITEGLLMIVFALLIISMSDEVIRTTAKTIVFFTLIFCSFVLMVWVAYVIDPRETYQSNKHIYDSTVGNNAIVPGNIYDYFSFNSGEGFYFRDFLFLRQKGYSNEPSSTIVHYFAPAILAFFLGGPYLWGGLFILLVNVIAISSFLAFMMIGFVGILYFPMKKGIFQYKGAFLVSLVFLILLLTGVDLHKLQISVGEYLFHQYAYTLLLTKEGSLLARTTDISEGLRSIFRYPLGGAPLDAIPLALQLILIGGWIPFILLIGWTVNFMKLLQVYFLRSQRFVQRFASCLACSMMVGILLLSGYGWNRLPGVIMLLLLARLAAISVNNQHDACRIQ